MNYSLVTTSQQLPELLEAISSAALVGMDTEFVAEDCFRPDLCLLQISTREAVYIIDPRSIEDLSGVWSLLVDGQRRVVVHAGREEILFAYRATGRSISSLFDVQLALGLLGGEFPASYGKLLQRLLGENVPKGETRTDWRKRPLSRAQLDYAALDVLHLPQLFDTLSQELENVGRTQWLVDEMHRRQNNLIETQEQEGWYRLSGVQSLYGKQLSVVRELWRWREQRAEYKNMPARRVLRDDLIIELAKRGSVDEKKIAHIRGLHHPGFQRFIPELAQCVAKGLAAEVPQAPWCGANKRPRPPALLQQYLTAAMSFLCRTHSIAPAIVGTSDDVGRLASYWLSGATLDEEDPEFPQLLRGWRAELVGHPLYHIFTGRRALRVQDPQDDMPLSLCDVEPQG
ncbi:MAG: HRDC domain-containing protein [Planctomycetales bacterium]|nr:HRDC domain-containing protein [Planctomycetales bacterium]